MKIEIWTDIVCPWCGVGTRQLEQALEQFEHAAGVELVHRSFLLRPDAAEGVSEPAAEFVQRKYKFSPEQLARTHERLEAMAHAAGLSEYHVADNDIGSTRLAHEFLAYASAQGKHEEAWRLMFSEYFGRKAPIWTLDDLLPLADKLGLDVDGARSALESRRHRSDVETDHDEAVRLGASGVPFIVVDRRYAIPGAQSPERILAVLERAWDDASRGAAE